jgi:hypothetical protein
MESGISLSCWKESITGPYPEPYESISHPRILLLQDGFQYYIPSTSRSRKLFLLFRLSDYNFVSISPLSPASPVS